MRQPSALRSQDGEVLNEVSSALDRSAHRPSHGLQSHGVELTDQTTAPPKQRLGLAESAHDFEFEAIPPAQRPKVAPPTGLASYSNAHAPIDGG